MNKTKKSKTIKMVVIIIVSVFLSPLIILFSLYSLVWLLSPNPPKPQVKYAEFPFEIVYELDGETVTVNDVYVCKYTGFGMNEGVGKYRSWKGYIKSTRQEDLVLVKDKNLQLACSLGGPEYYMSDPSMSESEHTPFIYYIKKLEFGGTQTGVMDIEPILEEYKLKLVSWKLSKPIENSFN